MSKKLTKEEEQIIINKGTELPFSGKYDQFFESGMYACKRCGEVLYSSKNKFDAKCGWPSFDDEIEGAIKRTPDPDGNRTEISCAKCSAHLGHVLVGEHLTDKNTRQCVNSLSLDFVPQQTVNFKKAYFAGGCFWGFESLIKQKVGVIKTKVGYMGGQKDKPTYEEVSTGETGHKETVEVIYDPKKITFENLAKYFFEIHDPTQTDGQGPDIGTQYQSVIFYANESEKNETQKLINILKEKGFDIATKLEKVANFWPAENYHQNYYAKTGKVPYCHSYTKRF
ncbi:bifunctional methionine sulfoxide reductase B/A protein [Candidatus Uhrbacteria bacterium]|nr:bifunctional methionine sulfoxide reductase B/A protein [Candidatus Uhrbacteria bacterium]